MLKTISNILPMLHTKNIFKNIKYMAVLVWSAFVGTCLLCIYHAAHSWLLYTV